MRSLDKSVQQTISDPDRLAVLKDVSSALPSVDVDLSGLATLAANAFNTPIGLVSVIDQDTQYFPGRFGHTEPSTPADIAFCAYTIAEPGGILVVPDATKDQRFAQNPVVTGPPNIRFYVGCAIEINGVNIGSICVLSSTPSAQPSKALLDQLRNLSKLAGSLIELKDQSSRRVLEKSAYRRATTRHLLATRAAGIGSWMWDSENDDVECDVNVYTMHGMDTLDDMTGTKLFAAIHPDDAQRVCDTIANAVRDDTEFRLEYRTADGNRWLLVQGQPLERGENRSVPALVGATIDITATKQREETTRLLLKELNHRVKNTLAMLQSLAAQTLRRAPTPRAFMDAFSGRLQALSAAHTLLSDQEWARIDVGALTRTIMAPSVAHFDARVAITGVDVAVSPDEGVGLALVLHELTTNALRHGALSIVGGKIDIALSVEAQESGDMMRLIWRESGGPAIRDEVEAGFGSLLIERGLQKTIGSAVSLDFSQSGLSAEIALPIASGALTYPTEEKKI